MRILKSIKLISDDDDDESDKLSPERVRLKNEDN